MPGGEGVKRPQQHVNAVDNHTANLCAARPDRIHMNGIPVARQGGESLLIAEVESPLRQRVHTCPFLCMTLSLVLKAAWKMQPCPEILAQAVQQSSKLRPGIGKEDQGHRKVAIGHRHACPADEAVRSEE